jgi:hypothetical protein
MYIEVVRQKFRVRRPRTPKFETLVVRPPEKFCLTEALAQNLLPIFSIRNLTKLTRSLSVHSQPLLVGVSLCPAEWLIRCVLRASARLHGVYHRYHRYIYMVLYLYLWCVPTPASAAKDSDRTTRKLSVCNGSQIYERFWISSLYRCTSVHNFTIS